MFARFGIPQILVTDNGPQFSSKEFQLFAKSWSFNHVTTSPRYPQSDGKAENAVRTVKRLFEKCKETGVSEFQALFEWRNTPSEGMDISLAQCLMGRRCRTLLTMAESLLRPSYPQDKTGTVSNYYYYYYYFIIVVVVVVIIISIIGMITYDVAFARPLSRPYNNNNTKCFICTTIKELQYCKSY